MTQDNFNWLKNTYDFFKSNPFSQQTQDSILNQASLEIENAGGKWSFLSSLKYESQKKYWEKKWLLNEDNLLEYMEHLLKTHDIDGVDVDKTIEKFLLLPLEKKKLFYQKDFFDIKYHKLCGIKFKNAPAIFHNVHTLSLKKSVNKTLIYKVIDDIKVSQAFSEHDYAENILPGVIFFGPSKTIRYNWKQWKVEEHPKLKEWFNLKLSLKEIPLDTYKVLMQDNYINPQSRTYKALLFNQVLPEMVIKVIDQIKNTSIKALANSGIEEKIDAFQSFIGYDWTGINLKKIHDLIGQTELQHPAKQALLIKLDLIVADMNTGLRKEPEIRKMKI